MVAFDYETTGIKPHRKGHRIVCCSLCWDDSASYAFMLQGEAIPALKKLLKSSTKKVAANMQYEDTWSRTLLGVQVNNWFFDTMLASHLIENRKGVCSLKFQAYANFGMGCYTDAVGLLKGERNDPNSLNGIDRIPEDSLLLYCGLDSLFEFKLAKKQLGIIRRWEQ
jgi:DNA polymerase I-like protein with 3'-5' exonuclease and polymerase domains